MGVTSAAVADEEELVGDVEHLAGHFRFLDGQAVVARQRDDAVTRDAREHGRGKRRRVDHVVANEEQILSAASLTPAGGVERDALGVAFERRPPS
jgi:hypothetical protein